MMKQSMHHSAHDDNSHHFSDPLSTLLYTIDLYLSFNFYQYVEKTKLKKPYNLIKKCLKYWRLHISEKIVKSVQSI